MPPETASSLAEAGAAPAAGSAANSPANPAEAAPTIAPQQAAVISALDTIASKPKSGFLTSEFFLLLVVIGGILGLAFEDKLPPLAGAIVIAAATAVFTHARSALKKEHASGITNLIELLLNHQPELTGAVKALARHDAEKRSGEEEETVSVPVSPVGTRTLLLCAVATLALTGCGSNGDELWKNAGDIFVGFLIAAAVIYFTEWVLRSQRREQARTLMEREARRRALQKREGFPPCSALIAFAAVMLLGGCSSVKIQGKACYERDGVTVCATSDGKGNVVIEPTVNVKSKRQLGGGTLSVEGFAK